MDQKNTLEKLQSLPYQTRARIMWVTVAIVAVALMFVLVQSIRSSVEGAGENLIKIESANPTNESSIKYAGVERVESGDKLLKIYFNFHNTTDGILNIPKTSEIRLKVGQDTFEAQKITDRQGKPFVQKILSHTQNFGILTFPATTEEIATLTFDGMSLESSPSNTFQQTLELNLHELNGKTEVRN